MKLRQPDPSLVEGCLDLEGERLTTITDVAKRAGVSPVTVSRVMNHVPNVNAATREKVERAIAELGYVPNVVARSLRSKRTSSIALLVPDITNPFWTTVARGVEDAAQSRGYTILLCNTDETRQKQAAYLEVVASQRVDGVIIAPFDTDAGHLDILRERNIPTVAIDRRISGWEVDQVLGDSVGGAHALVQHLIRLGQRRIGIISGPRETSTADDRVAGYRLALADGGLPYDPDLVHYGEYRPSTGERFTNALLDLDSPPTAIFAANNSIALGVIDAVGARGLRVPQDIALVSFDDLVNASHWFPFLTVAVQPAYDMGINAAQLLFSRLDAVVPLQPRVVHLPSRLIVRYSCGAHLGEVGSPGLSLPLPGVPEERSFLVPTLDVSERAGVKLGSNGGGVLRGMGRRPVYSPEEAALDKPDIGRLLKVLRHEEADRVPHLEFWVTSQQVYEYVLERELKYEVTDARLGCQSVAPEDDVEFAQRLGMDAVTCNFSWRPGNIFRPASDGMQRYAGGRIKARSDLDSLEPPPPLTDQLSHLEGYLRAAQGTGVGVIANFTSFFDSALLAMGLEEGLRSLRERRGFVELLMDRILRHQTQVMRAVCDRFAPDLALILVNDDIAFRSGLLIHPALFEEVFRPRMSRLIEPALEHKKLLALHSDGKIGAVLPLLYDLGFRVIHPVEPECNDLEALREEWRGRMAFIGNVPMSLLQTGNEEEIASTVRHRIERLAPGGGYVVGTSNSVSEGVQPERFVTMTQAVHRYGRYDRLQAEPAPHFG